MANNKIKGELSKLIGERPHPNDLWISLINATDSLLLERDKELGALTQFYITQANIKPIEDAAFALIIATAVEQALELALSTHFGVSYEEGQFVFDYSRNGPLAEFASKIKMAYVLGIIPAIAKEELDLIRFVRNAFAHSWQQLKFGQETVASACDKLLIPKIRKDDIGGDAADAKSQYLLSARHLYVYLEWDSLAAKRGPMLFANHPAQNLFKEMETLQAAH